MTHASLFLIEGGFPEDLPGFSRHVPSASFPFWGGYCFLDFAAAISRDAGLDRCILVAENRFRTLSSFIASRAQRTSRAPRSREDGQALVLLEDGIEEFLQVVGEETAEVLLFAPASLLYEADPKALRSALDQSKGRTFRLNVGSRETDLYCADRKAFLQAATDYRRRHELRPEFPAALFRQLLPGCFEAMRKVPGSVWVDNNLTDLYKQNLRAVTRGDTPEVAQTLRRLGPARVAEKGPAVGRGGTVRNSLLASGVRVEGYVEGSFLFPGVVVHRGATVVDSVVMNGNRIGARAQVYKTLVLPYGGEAPSANIGEGVTIGDRESGARNFDHPKQVREGVTVIGMNVELPKGFKISSGSLVGAGIGPQRLRGIKELQRGSSVL